MAVRNQSNNVTGYGVGEANIALAPVPQKWNRAPTSADLGFPVGYLAIYNGTIYGSAGTSAGVATWVVLGGSSSDVNTINGLSPTAGNIDIDGTTDQIAVDSTGSTITLSLDGPYTPATYTDHGVLVGSGSGDITALSVGATGTVLAGSTGADPAFTATPSGLTSVTATSFITSSATIGTTYTDNSITPTGSDAAINLLINGKGTGSVIQSRGVAGGDLTIENTNTDNTDPASRSGVEIAVGGTSAGDPYINFLVSGAGVYTMGIDNSASDNFVLSASAALGTSDIVTISSAGALATASTITATAGAITATNGNFVGSASGTGILLNSPAASGAAASPVVVNGRSGAATFTSVSIAAAADLTLTVTNSAITGSSTQVIYSLAGVTTGAALSIKSVTNSSGSSAVVVTNGTGATTSTADIVLTFLVLN